MPTIISSNVQSRWKDCYAPSPRVRLTMRSNGEEGNKVITPQAAMVQAGFDAPTVAPTVALSGSSGLTANTFFAYRYVYASSKYPFVDNAVTGGGQLWPRSNPSPDSIVQSTGGSAKTATVTVTKTTRSDVDNIWIYRTTLFSASDEAQAAADAGQMFYIGSVANNGIAGTTTYTDSNPVDTAEILELDNYTAPTTQFCLFDGTYWWAIGNFPFDYEVTVNSTSVVTLTGYPKWFDGRNGQTATFDGVTTGGYDGNGSYYFKWTSPTTATMYSDTALTNAVVVPYNGTTRIHMKGFSTTLYRSKPLNPFSWGKTDVTFNADGSAESVSSEYAVSFGSGEATAMSLIGNDSYLVLSFEEPTRMIRLALDQADSDAFILTRRDIDTQTSFGSHFSQVIARFGNRSILSGIDTKNGDVMATNGDSISLLSDEVFQTMRSAFQDEFASRFFHGVYDAQTEITAWWIKTKSLSSNLTDTCLLLHSPTSRWTIMPDQNVSASATIFDPKTKETFTAIGTEQGIIGTAFDQTYYGNFVSAAAWKTQVPDFSTIGSNQVLIPQQFTQVASISNVSGTNWLITMNAGDEVPGIGATIDFYNNSNVKQGQGIVTSSAFVFVDAVNSYSTYSVTSADNLSTVTEYSMNATTLNGVWCYVVPADSTIPGIWFRLSGGTSNATRHTFSTDCAYLETDTYGFSSLLSLFTQYGAPVNGDALFIGCIPCRHRRYFDLDEPTKQKGLKEAWANLDNVGMHYCRLFPEYESTLINGFRFQLTQRTRNDGTNPSSMWSTYTAAPTSLLNAFGFEIQELGWGNFNNRNYVLKINSPDSGQTSQEQ